MNVLCYPSGYFEYYYSRMGLDAEEGCAKRYEKNGNKCTKTETLNRIAN